MATDICELKVLDGVHGVHLGVIPHGRLEVVLVAQALRLVLELVDF